MNTLRGGIKVVKAPGSPGLNHWTVISWHVVEIVATWVWRAIASLLWSLQLRSRCFGLGSLDDLWAKPIRAIEWEQCAITVIRWCFDKGLSASVPPVCQRAFCNIGRGLWERLRGCMPQFNSMCAAISELSGWLNQLHRVVEPVPPTHVTPYCFYWRDQIHTWQ